MAKADYYETLGVTRYLLRKSGTEGRVPQGGDAVPPPISTPWRHSDGRIASFKEVNEAYQTPLRRARSAAAYDRFGHAAFEQGRRFRCRHGFAAEGFGSSMADIFDDLFGDMMGRRGGRQGAGGAGRGSDLRYNMEITLEEAFHGKTASLKLPTSVSCDTCAGSGAKPGAKPRTCSMCHGQGRVRAQQGFFAIERTCPTCQGRGEMIDNPCTACAGSGRVTRERQLSVNIPAGVEDGTRIRLSGEGEAGTRGGPAGDLYIFVSTKPHPFFQRDGADLFCRVPISMVQAALGGEIAVRAVDGSETKVKIPEGTQSGKQFKVRSKGMPVLRSRDIGDLYIQTTVETPQALTRRQRELLAEFEAESSHKTHPEASGFFAKMKDFFENLSGA